MQVGDKRRDLCFYDRTGRLLARVKRSNNILYVLSVKTSHPICLLRELRDMAWLWHTLYVHLNFQALSFLTKKGMVKGTLGVEHVT